MLIAFNKPYGVLSQFTSDGAHPTLADFIDVPGVYAAGRLDRDSEGLLLLTDDGMLQAAIADPRHRHPKTYWAQVEGIPDPASLARFAAGLDIGEGRERFLARPAGACAIAAPEITERDPPIRVRASSPTSWIEVVLTEGRNRQVRRMTAAIGHPTLRLIRAAIGPLRLAQLGIDPGSWIEVDADRLTTASISAEPAQPRRERSTRKPFARLSTGLRTRR